MSQSVDSLLRLQLDKLQAFDRLLIEEHACLLRAATDQLPALTERKNSLLAEIDALERERIVQFGALTEAGATSAPPLWSAVQTLARSIAEANQRNGAMISALVRSTEGALQILRGNAEGVDLYGAHGQGQPGSGPVRLQVSA
ncbi:MAG: flagellar protein FlgN [Thiomonas arsenitoxydans]|uniref:Flagellar protein FlgN n=1 Tax=Thiomonas arsenitoxydans (strain DSM 22701 / CIP 110005 / 3As) TaxID=426114 RepID=A0A8I1N098_THIA3|nr:MULTISPECIES: flagellar protein FlgN [Thiomonas]MBN8745232.1 flagellar protein FlgN [Thiomonas arsenitoxydans]ODU96342.1 MAG: flagellar biosynthesis protein FlgN [Thiomonas sp. SCN 64-16]